MNLEMPSPEEADSLRTLLLVVLGVMIVTIPVVCLIVVSRVMAQRRLHQKPAGPQTDSTQNTAAAPAAGVLINLSPHVPISSSGRNPDDTPHKHSSDCDSPGGGNSSGKDGGTWNSGGGGGGDSGGGGGE